MLLSLDPGWGGTDIYFGLFLQHFLGVIISDQTCNAPNAPKISSIMIRISMKLNLGFILAIL